MATLPTVPSFVANDTSLTKLTQLAGAVSFLVDCGTRPVWHFYKTATQAIPTTAWTTMNATTVAIDSDSVFTTGGIATIKTQGYYSVESCAQILSPGVSSVIFVGGILFTAGSSNPHFTAGTTVRFGKRGGATVPEASIDTAFCVSGIVPTCCYIGDTLAPQVFIEAAVTLNNNANASYASGRMVCNFTGYWMAEGT